MTKEYQVLASDKPAKELNAGPGLKLEHARVEANLSVEEVASRLCLRVSVIESLEVDDYSNIPRHVFARGYLRAYAKLLNIGADDIIDSFNNLNIKEITYEKTLFQATKATDKKETPVKWLVIGMLMFSSMLAVMWWSANKPMQATNNETIRQDNKISTLKSANELVDIDLIDQATIIKGKN
jgi:cytoskeleton protein RodZ